jgi:hypothetical protein
MRAEARLSILTEEMKDELREVTTSIVMSAKACQDRVVGRCYGTVGAVDK